MFGLLLLRALYLISKVIVFLQAAFWIVIALYNMSGLKPPELTTPEMTIVMELAFGFASAVAVSAKWRP